MAAENGADRRWRKRSRGFVSAAAVAAPVVTAAGAARGFADRRLIAEWPSIAGPEIARLCQPVEISHRGKQARLGATLVVTAPGALAPEVSHMAERIVERVNAVYGYRAVTRLRVVQTGAAGGAWRAAEAHAAGFAEPAAGFEPAPALDAPPSADICAVGDASLREALALLERNIRAAARRRAAR